MTLLACLLVHPCNPFRGLRHRSIHGFIDGLAGCCFHEASLSVLLGGMLSGHLDVRFREFPCLAVIWPLRFLRGIHMNLWEMLRDKGTAQ
jgi:hypothetical protein